MVIHLAGRDEDVAIDYREAAPQATTHDIFPAADGKPGNTKYTKSGDSALSIGVPGTVAGLSLALEKYGSGHFTLAQLIKPLSISPATALQSLTTWRTPCRAAKGGYLTGRRRRKSSPLPTERPCATATNWCGPISRLR
jgi:Gamma-glutamyltranspeptidase